MGCVADFSLLHVILMLLVCVVHEAAEQTDGKSAEPQEAEGPETLEI